MNKKILLVNIPKELKKRKQWVAWKYGEPESSGKKSKIPINPKTGQNAAVNKRKTWGSFQKALWRFKKVNLAGIGFVFTSDDPYVGIDLDECRNPENGEIEPWAEDILEQVKSYAEVSPSGTGLKMIARGKLPGRGRKNDKVEMYDDKRFFTITGQILNGSPKKITKKPQTIKSLYKKYFGIEENIVRKDDGLLPCTLTEQDILDKAMKAANGDKFRRLWEGTVSEYPSESEADLALCAELAFWTGKDKAMMDSLFKQSGLMRDKWKEMHDSENHRTYGQMTVEKAIDSCQSAYNPSSNKTDVNSSILMEQLKLLPPKEAIKKILANKDDIQKLALLRNINGQEYETFMANLKEMGVPVRDVDSLKRVINSVRKGMPYTQCLELVSVREVIRDAPVSEKVVVPPGWRIGFDGVFEEKSSKGGHSYSERVAPYPILIQGHLKNITDGSEDLRIIWGDGEAWKHHITDRVNIADARLIVKLSDYGCPVTSATATPLVKFLSEFEAINKHNLPHAIATHQLGWQGEAGKNGFLWGKNLITPDGKVMRNMDIDTLPPDEWPEELIFFKGHDTGQDQIAKGFDRKGENENWLKILPLIDKYPLVTFSIYAALAPPLLLILDEPNFVVDWAFPTSRGKTTTLKIAASCWGNPDQRSPSSMIKSWDVTRVFLERYAIVQKDLPLILDDTKRAKKPEFVSQMIYDISSGQGKGRGSVQGIKETGSWRTIALSTGESKATSFTMGDGGAYARVLSIWGSPFGKKDKRKAKLISKLTKIMHKNYGHAGYRFVKHLIKNKKKWKLWRKQYTSLIGMYRDEAGLNEVALRQCSYFAVIHLVAQIAKEALGLSLHYKKHLKKIYRKAIFESSEADRAKEALQLVISWAMSNKDSFWTKSADKQPPAGWLGAWNPLNRRVKDRQKEWQENDDDGLLSLGFLPHTLEKYLKERGFEPKSIIRTWKDKGWLDMTGETKGLTRKLHLGHQRTRGYVLNEKAIKQANH